MIFLTEHKYKNIDTPRINAKDWEEAESICPSYLRVIGILDEEWKWDISDDNLYKKIVKLN